MIILLFIDNITGFILALCLLAFYFKLYSNELKNQKSSDILDEQKNEASNKVDNTENVEMCSIDKPCKLQIEKKDNNINTSTSTQIPYTSEEHLLAAQNNIVSEENYNNEIVGINENVYGSQGLDNKNIHIQGYDEKNSFMGTLNFNIY